jgi:hypothetical protein
VNGGLPRLQLPVTPQNVAVASAFAAAFARTVDATEATVDYIRAVVSDIATACLERGATMVIEAGAHSGSHALVVRLEDSPVVGGVGFTRDSTLSARVIVEADHWVIPIAEPTR